MLDKNEKSYSWHFNILRHRVDVKRGWMMRLCIGLVFICSLFVFLHYREIKIDNLKLNSISDRYIVTELDFDFYDEAATRILKQESLRDIGKIYKLKEKQVHQRRLEFEDFLMRNHGWRRLVEYATFEEMYRGGDELEETLLNTNVTNGRTFKKMQELHLPVVNYYVINVEDSQQTINFSEKNWQEISEIAFADQIFYKGTAQFIISYFRNKSWIIEEDFVAMRQISKLVQDNIADKYTKVRAGSRIIVPGEKVTKRHIDMFNAMHRAMKKERNLWEPSTWTGSLIIAVLFTLACYGYMRRFFPNTVYNHKKLMLLVSVVIINLLLAKVAEYFLTRGSHNLFELVRYPIMSAFSAVLLFVLLNQRIAFFVSVFMSIIFSLAFPIEYAGFIILNIIASSVVVLSVKSLYKRRDIFVVCFKAFLVCVLGIIGFNLYDGTLYDFCMIADVLTSMAFMLSTAVLVVGFLPLFEAVFSVLTDVTLVEYMDPSHELLRRLSIEAPGTYQHAVVVGNIAERAAMAIGANGLFCRVATLYHDIGKLVTPHYFTENQQSGINMHHLLTPIESAQVIIGHIREGVNVARKAHLPEPFIDIIREHHGTTRVYFFYRKQCELVGGDKTLVNEEEFRYFGPRPQTRESAIIMITDSIEAASRTLKELNEKTVTALVEDVINEKAEDGQFDNCQLTFEELAIVKREIVKTLVAAGHSRIKYPKKD